MNNLLDKIEAIARRGMDRRVRIVILWCVGPAAILILAGCGGGSGSDYAARLRGEIAVPASAGLPTLAPAPTAEPTPTAYPTQADASYPTSAPLLTIAPVVVAPEELASTARPLPTAEPAPAVAAPQVIYVTATPAPLPAVLVVIATDTDGGTCRPTTAEPCEVQP